MILDRISYERVRNLGNYESERIHLEATVEPGEQPVAVFNALRAEAYRYLGLRLPPPIAAPAEDEGDLPL